MERLVRDGVGLAYLEVGSGEPPLLLVHGWLCDHTYLAPQIEHFSQQHRVVAVDLRGHGASDTPLQEYSMAALADDLAWLCEQLDIQHPVVIAHSMGGLVALELLMRAPNLPRAIVALDSPILMPDARFSHLQALGPLLEGPDYRGEVQGMVRGMFLPTDDAQRRGRIVEQMSSVPQHVMLGAFQGMFGTVAASATHGPPIPVPLLAVASAGGHMADLERLRQLCPQVTIGQTVGAGHFHQLDVPDQINAMIERFLALTLPGSSPAA